MASEDKLSSLWIAILDIRSLEKDRIIRANLIGSDLVQELESLLSKLESDCELYDKYASHVHNDHVYNVASELSRIHAALSKLQLLKDDTYTNHITQTMTDVREYNRLLTEHKYPFLVFKHEENLFSDSDLKRATKFAKELLKKMEDSIRDASIHLSIIEAQSQFGSNQGHLKTRSKQWFWASVGCMIALFALVTIFALDINPRGIIPDREFTNWPESIYHTVMRITLLGVLGAAASFCLRIYRSHVHMLRHNQHRIQIANNIKFFMSSAATREHKDMILHCLIQAVATFGPSGLIRDKDDPVTSSKTIVDRFATLLENE